MTPTAGGAPTGNAEGAPGMFPPPRVRARGVRYWGDRRRIRGDTVRALAGSGARRGRP